MSVTAERGEAVPTSVLVGATLVVAALHLWIGARIGQPSVVFDEAGYLGNARWLAGTGSGWEMPWSPRYAVGYPLVLAPVVWLFSEPEQQWRAVLALNAVLLALVLPLLFLVVRRVLGASPRAALPAATVGAVVPAVLAAGVSAIAENLVLPLVPLTVLATWALCRPGPTWTRLLFAPCIVALYATHPRFIVALPVAVAVLVWVGWRRLAPRAVVVANAVVLGAGAFASWLLTAAVVASRWDHVEVLEGGPRDVLRLASSRAGLAELTWTAVGQAWYLAVGSLGLVVIGVAFAVHRLRAEAVRARADEVAGRAGAREDEPEHPDGEDQSVARGESSAAEARAVALAALLALAVGVFVVSVAFFAQNQFRDDHLVYGRHNAAFTSLWSAFALTALIVATRRQVLRAVAGAAGVVVLLSTMLLLTREADGFGGVYSPFAVPSLVRFTTSDPSRAFWFAGVVAVLGLVVVALVAGVARRPRVLAVPLALAALWSGLGAVDATEFFQGWTYAGWTAADEVTRLGVDAVTVDGRVAGGVPALSYPFHLPEVRFSTYESVLGEAPDEVYVLASTTDDHLAAVGARIALIDLSGFYPDAGVPEGVALWVQPGPELDRLEAEGALLPAGFPTGLPAEARRASLDVVGAPEVVEVAPGGVATFQLRGRHAGSGSPWPDQASYGRDARVRLVAEIRPEPEPEPEPAPDGGGGDEEVSGATTHPVGELPHWVRPGDEFVAEVSVTAGGLGSDPLEPGRYRVTFGVGQGRPEWSSFAEQASVVLVVTG